LDSIPLPDKGKILRTGKITGGQMADLQENSYQPQIIKTRFFGLTAVLAAFMLFVGGMALVMNLGGGDLNPFSGPGERTTRPAADLSAEEEATYIFNFVCAALTYDEARGINVPTEDYVLTAGDNGWSGPLSEGALEYLNGALAGYKGRAEIKVNGFGSPYAIDWTSLGKSMVALYTPGPIPNQTWPARTEYPGPEYTMAFCENCYYSVPMPCLEPDSCGGSQTAPPKSDCECNNCCACFDCEGCDGCYIASIPGTQKLIIATEFDSYTVNDKVIKYTVTNPNDFDLHTGEVFHLLKLNILPLSSNAVWEMVPFKEDIAFNAIAWVVMPGEPWTAEINIETYFGSLEAGTYRLCKCEYSVCQETASSDFFTINRVDRIAE